MRAGRLDRRITIQGKSITHDDAGEEVVTWGDVATVWAEKIEQHGNERFAAQQLVGHAVTTFKIRWSTTVLPLTTEHRIVFAGRNYDITDVREGHGRHESLEIDCFAPSEQPVAQ